MGVTVTGVEWTQRRVFMWMRTVMCDDGFAPRLVGRQAELNWAIRSGMKGWE